MPRRREPGIMVPTASMGDIAFLLTIFFILSSNFAKEAGIKASPPKSPDVGVLKESRISVVVDKQGDIYLQGRKIPDAEAVEWGVAALMQGRPTEESRTVMFTCDRAVDKAQFEPVLDAIARAGAPVVAIGEKGALSPGASEFR